MSKLINIVKDEYEVYDVTETVLGVFESLNEANKAIAKQIKDTDGECNCKIEIHAVEDEK